VVDGERALPAPPGGDVELGDRRLPEPVSVERLTDQPSALGLPVLSRHPVVDVDEVTEQLPGVGAFVGVADDLCG